MDNELPQTGRRAESCSECVGVKACDDTYLLSFYALQPFLASKLLSKRVWNMAVAGALKVALDSCSLHLGRVGMYRTI